MNDLKRQVQKAFDELHAPQEVKQQTLAAIEAARAQADSAPAAAANSSATISHQETTTPPTQRFRAWRTRRFAAALAACLALIAVCAGGYQIYMQPTAFVGIDVNPSLELEVNRFGVVVDARALNDDAASLLERVSLKQRSYTDALASLAQSEAFASYLQEDAFVEISVTSDDEQQSQTLCAQSDSYIRELPCSGSCSAVDAQTRNEAAQAGMGVGRYRAACELIALDDSYTLEECSSMSMRELRDHIEACSHEGGESSSDTSHGGAHNAASDTSRGGANNAASGTSRGNARGNSADTSSGNSSGTQGTATDSCQGNDSDGNRGAGECANTQQTE